ncbi:MAG: methylated-DNA--[protein]-cysteine S-methyltransferase [Promethearchaeota archaeon]
MVIYLRPYTCVIMFYSIFGTRFGTCGIIYKNGDAKQAIRILLPKSKKEIKSQIARLCPGVNKETSSTINGLISEISQYLEGKDIDFTKGFIDTSICYPFQLRVLRTEWTIPRGKTATYGWIAEKIGTRGVRAVGNANARNPFPMVIPCHRVIRSDRTLGGFGGGLDMKRRLLEMEGIRFDSSGRVMAEYTMPF